MTCVLNSPVTAGNSSPQYCHRASAKARRGQQVTVQVTLIQMKPYLEKLHLNWINSTIQYPANHSYTWIRTGKSMAYKQQEYLTGSKCWLWCLCFHTPGFDSGQSSTYWCSNSTLSNYISFPFFPYSHYVPLFFTFSPLNNFDLLL